MHPVPGHRRLIALAVAGVLVAMAAWTSLGTSPRTAAGEISSTGNLVKSPATLLGELQSTPMQMQQSSRSSFFDVFMRLAPVSGIGSGCDMLVQEARAKGYRRNGKPLPASCAALLKTTARADSFFDVSISDPQRQLSEHLAAASLETDTNTMHGSRAYFDIWLDAQNPDASIVQLSLTNNWSDQPEVVKAAKGGLQVNGQSRFFVDVARVISRPTVNAARQRTLVWYHYWWYDSHAHNWWWYGPYSWWYWQYSWYGGVWWWWWNGWWPWWHSYHWYFWSNWWSDLNPNAQP